MTGFCILHNKNMTTSDELGYSVIFCWHLLIKFTIFQENPSHGVIAKQSKLRLIQEEILLALHQGDFSLRGILNEVSVNLSGVINVLKE